MQMPDALLADRTLSSTEKTLLDAYWRRAEGSPPWTAARNDEIASTAGLSERHVIRVRADLVARGAMRQEARQLAGRRVDGWGLLTLLLPLQVPRLSPATDNGGTGGVAKREKAHTYDRLEADLAQIAKHARPGDSAKAICERLVKARAPCSSEVVAQVAGVVEICGGGVVVVLPRGGGDKRHHAIPAGSRLRVAPGARVKAGEPLIDAQWHRVKVHRRVKQMAKTLGLHGKGLREGDIVQRWKKSRGT